MARHLILVAAAAGAFAVPASAGVTVIGNSLARSCYEAAERNMPPRAEDLRTCDAALESGNSDFSETVATRVNRGILYLRGDQLDLAMRDFDAALALDPNEPETYLNRGSAFMKRDDAANAIAMFDQAIARNTRRPELAYFARGAAQEASGNIPAAYRDYRRAAELAPRWADPRVELARFRVVRN